MTNVWKIKEYIYPEKNLLFQLMKLSSSKIKKFCILPEMELSSSKMNKFLIFPERNFLIF